MPTDIVVGWHTKISEDNTKVGLERANIHWAIGESIAVIPNHKCNVHFLFSEQEGTALTTS